MRTIRQAPAARQLLESMRSIGYSHETAVADLIDNSITAEASVVKVLYPAGRPTVVGILDDGSGMSETGLIEAMRHGSRGPTGIRANDLGRFGLGLKTASLSQCQSLIVASVSGTQIHACEWDLDHVEEAGDWSLRLLDAPEIEELPYIEYLCKQGRGTLVLWQKLDQLAAGDSGDGRVFGERMDAIRSHLAMVFHRYLTPGPGVHVTRIEMNANPVEPFDPFLLKHPASYSSPVERIVVDSSEMQVQAHTLPHISMLSAEQIATAGGAEGLRRHQGFYIYRNRRLIIWGTWFRLTRQEELTKLTRVQVDIPNTLDHLWALDVKKSVATPPEAVKQRLRALLPTMCAPSRQTQVFRATRQTSGSIAPLWIRLAARDGSVEYRVDREHPVIRSFTEELDDGDRRWLNILLKAVEDSFPGEAFYNDRANERLGHAPSTQSIEERNETRAYLEDLARNIIGGLRGDPAAAGRMVVQLKNLEPFVRHPEMVAEIQERLLNE